MIVLLLTLLTLTPVDCPPLDRHGVRPLVFEDRRFCEVAALEYDDEAGVCRQVGDLVDAFRVLRAAYEQLSEERDRLRWGSRQVDEWKRERR